MDEPGGGCVGCVGGGGGGEDSEEDEDYVGGKEATDDEYDSFAQSGKIAYTGVHDLAGTLAKITDDAPVILMAHEPDIFPEVPSRVALTIAGHTHGGQIRIFGMTPVVPSKYGSRYAYGHIVEDNRHLVVSAGLGVSGIPLRFGSPPEIVVIELGSGGGV